jgi:hypothetical protein
MTDRARDEYHCDKLRRHYASAFTLRGQPEGFAVTDLVSGLLAVVLDCSLFIVTAVAMAGPTFLEAGRRAVGPDGEFPDGRVE